MDGEGCADAGQILGLRQKFHAVGGGSGHLAVGGKAVFEN